MIKQLIKISIVLPLFLNGQIYRDDIRLVMQSMASMKNYSMRVHYKLYLDGNTTKAFQESSTQIIKNESALYCKQSNGLEFMSNRNYEVSADVASHEITARQKKTREESQSEDLINSAITNMDTLLSIYDDVKILSNTKNKITYKLHLKPGQALQSLIVCIDKEKKMMVKVQYNYKEALAIKELKNTKHTTLFEITYENIVTGLIKDPAVFNEKKYLAFDRGKIKPAAKYKGYTLTILN